jgi:hypothetical protein
LTSLATAAKVSVDGGVDVANAYGLRLSGDQFGRDLFEVSSCQIGHQCGITWRHALVGLACDSWDGGQCFQAASVSTDAMWPAGHGRRMPDPSRYTVSAVIQLPIPLFDIISHLI